MVLHMSSRGGTDETRAGALALDTRDDAALHEYVATLTWQLRCADCGTEFEASAADLLLGRDALTCPECSVSRR
jgi:DNA-directed RNA polymerase subunit RPC12/RpoP